MNTREPLAVLAGDLSGDSLASGLVSMVGSSSMKYAHWTNQEVRRLCEVHIDGNPSPALLGKMFPRHPRSSIRNMARCLNLRHNLRHNRTSYYINRKWLKIAHLHFAEREK